MRPLMGWWNTACERCQAVSKVITNSAKLAGSLMMIGLFLSSGLFIYWIFFDNQPAIYYGPNVRPEFYGDRIIFHLDATRIRDCPTEIKRKIAGCGQIDWPSSFASTPVGQRAGPVSFPLSDLFQSFSREQLSGSVCTFISEASSYCNPAQVLLRIPIKTQSYPIQFVPVPRTKSYDPPTP